MKITLIAVLLLSAFSALAQDVTTIAFNEELHDFGNLPRGANVYHEFEVTNTGTIPLVISNVQTSCGCDVPSWEKNVILPGKKGKIGYRYDSNRIGPINKTMTITGNFEGGQKVVRVKGQIFTDLPLPEVTIWPKNHLKPNDNLVPAEKNMLKDENPK